MNQTASKLYKCMTVTDPKQKPDDALQAEETIQSNLRKLQRKKRPEGVGIDLCIYAGMDQFRYKTRQYISRIHYNSATGEISRENADSVLTLEHTEQSMYVPYENFNRCTYRLPGRSDALPGSARGDTILRRSINAYNVHSRREKQ